MDWQRTLLLGGLAVVVVLLFQEWNRFEQQRRPLVDRSTTGVVSPAIEAEIPNAPAEIQTADDEIPTVAGEQPQRPQSPSSRGLISVKTDVLDVLIDPLGGDIVKVAFPRYLKKLESEEPFILLNNNRATTYVAKSGLAGSDGTDRQGGIRPLFDSASSEYRLADSETLKVDLVYRQAEVRITKRFTFRRGDYLVDLDYLVDNRSNRDWKAALYAQIKRDGARPESDAGFGMQPFVGAALTTPEDNYLKFSFSDIAEKGYEETYKGGWVAMLQHYFMSAWIPPQDQKNSYRLSKINDNYLLDYVGPLQTVGAGQSGELKTRFYAGPKIINRLEQIHPHLDLTVDHGWAWWISKPLFWLLDILHNLVGNWGWAILLLTICVRIPMYPLFAKSARSMAGMRKIQPEMQRLKELYGDNRQKMSQEMMGLYKKHRVNPMGGCLPMLLPLPIFLGLYYMLFESVELRHADWLWLADLSVKDPLFILPLIMGLTMWLQQKLNPQPAEPSMATAMKIMPIVFTFMFMWFPAGLVLYWTINNLFSIAQSWVVNKKLGV